MATAGTVRWFNAEKGYGFIGMDGGEDYFVHYTDIAGEGYRKLNEGQRVEFEIVESTKKPGKQRAANVRVVEQVAR